MVNQTRDADRIKEQNRTVIDYVRSLIDDLKTTEEYEEYVRLRAAPGTEPLQNVVDKGCILHRRKKGTGRRTA
jgi:hypothetical protein